LRCRSRATSRISRICSAAAQAVDTYGGFDTWINNAGVSIFGTAAAVPLEDQRRLFDTNYWGVVHGSLVASDHFRRKGDFHGGAIINSAARRPTRRCRCRARMSRRSTR
jgi:NAD(P)-dependent dehydrogenase (short-subunit alcohol dehydrogenase family)